MLQARKLNYRTSPPGFNSAVALALGVLVPCGSLEQGDRFVAICPRVE